MLKKLFFFFIVNLFAGTAFAQWENIKTPQGLTTRILYNANGTMYAGTENGVYKLVGEVWTKLSSDLDNKTITSLIQHNNYLFAGTLNSGIYRSSNSGATWLQVNNNLSLPGVLDIKPYKNYLVIAATNGVYMSDNNGIQWLDKSGKLPSRYATSIAILNDSLFIGTDYGVYGSADTGLTWQAKASGFSNYKEIRSLVVDGTKMIAATPAGVYTSIDEGLTWQTANVGLTEKNVLKLYFDGTRIFALTTGGVFVATSTATMQWQPKPLSIPPTLVTAMINNGTTLFVGNTIGIYKEGNGGFDVMENEFPNAGIVATFEIADELLVSTDKGVWKLNDASGEWSYQQTFPNDFIKGVLQYSDNKLLMFTSSSIYSSVSNAESWTKVTDVQGVISLYVNENIIYAPTASNGVYRSTDGGNTWLQVNIGLTNLGIKDFIADDTYIYVTSDKLYRSNTNGDEWEPVGDKFSTYLIEEKENALYRVTSENTLYWTMSKSSDHGNTWTDIIKNPSLHLTYDYILSAQGNFKVIDSLMFFELRNINISLNDELVWYHFAKGYDDQEIADIIEVFKRGDNIYVRNSLNKLWKRSVFSLIPPTAPASVKFKKTADNVLTVEWNDKTSNESSFEIRRYWEYADIHLPANSETTTFDLDTLSQSPGILVDPFYVYANSEGDWSLFTQARESLNNAPHIDVITDLNISLSGGTKSVNLKGINDGDGGTQIISITAAATSLTGTGLEDIVNNLSISYTNPASTAVLKFDPVAEGAALITVTVTDDGGGANESFSTSFQVNVRDAVITEIEKEKDGMSLFPNPVKSEMVISFPGAGQRKIRVFNALAQLISSVNVASPNMTMNLSDYKPGVYFVEVIDGKKRTVQKIYKEK
jgi:photosystem II stability/assembly factor-like uncharacterized protein